MRNKSVILLFVVVLAVLSSCSRQSGKVIASVDGTKITERELKTEIAMEQNKYDTAILSHKANFEQLKKRALDKLIQETVLLNEAKRLNIGLTDAERTDAEKSINDMLSANEDGEAIKERGIDPKAWGEAQKKRMLIQKLILNEVLGKIPISDEKAAAYYKSHRQEFNRPAQFHARQIIVDSRERAEQILARLKNGEDFAALAKEYSLSPDGKRGGDLGFFDARTYPEAFTEVCGQLKIGELSGVVQTDYGFQIFELLDKRPAREIPFEEATAEIKRRLREERGEAAIAKWSSELEANAKVVIDEEAFKGVS